MSIQLSPLLQATYPGSAIGILHMRGVSNASTNPLLIERAEEIEKRLRSCYAAGGRDGLRSIPVVAAYEDYYRCFKKTYHVRLQLESVVLKGKPLPRAGAVLQAMFMAELESHLLTAGHDADVLDFPLEVGVADGSERYTLLGGKEQQCKEGDMKISDTAGVISSIVYGPDQRTRLTPESRSVCFTVYGVPGVGNEAVRDHLRSLQDLLRLAAPDAEVLDLSVWG